MEGWQNVSEVVVLVHSLMTRAATATTFEDIVEAAWRHRGPNHCACIVSRRIVSRRIGDTAAVVVFDPVVLDLCVRRDFAHQCQMPAIYRTYR